MQGQAYRMTARFRDSSITQPRLGQRLELECVGAREDSGVFWVRQDKDGTLHFIVFISALHRTTFKGNEKTSTRFEARKFSSVYYLVVKSFTRGDEGNYFCLMSSNQVLYFSRGQPAFIPGQRHLHPASLSSAKMPPPPARAFFNQSPLPLSRKSHFPCLLAQGILCPMHWSFCPRLPACCLFSSTPHPYFSILFMALKG